MISRRSKAGFISFLWLLAALAVIYFLVSKMFNASFKSPALDKNTGSYQSMMTNVKSRLNVSSQQEIDRVKEMEELSQ